MTSDEPGRPLADKVKRTRLGRLVSELRNPQNRPAPALDFPERYRVDVEGPRTPRPVPDNELEVLGEKYGPTKRLHNYLRRYWTYFRDIRNDVRTLCEIGVQSDRSIRMWEEFFPNATIHGVDIDPACASLSGGRCQVHTGDQSDPDFLSSVIDSAGGFFDIVIDDGSHLVEHQLTSMNVLFPALSSHGIYAIEDTGGCVFDYGLNTANAIKKLVDNIMFWPPEVLAQDDADPAEFGDTATWADRNIVGVSFYRWLIFIQKGRNPLDNPWLSA